MRSARSLLGLVVVVVLLLLLLGLGLGLLAVDVLHTSMAAARMAGATTSRVAFMSTSASHSNTRWICFASGFCRSATVKAMPMSVMHPAISRSGWGE